MSAKRPGQKVTMTSIDELLCIPETEGTIDIDVNAIYPFENHPFKVVDDEKMNELVESIKTSGVLTPVLVRPDDEGTYEMISGHRRLHAAKRAGLRKIPAIVKELTNDEATIAMVDANVQREEVLPSEKAFAFRLKLEAIKRQGMRRELTSPQNGGRLDDDSSRNNGRRLEAADIIGQSVGTSGTQVQRFVRLTELVPRLLQMVDKKSLAVSVGVELSFLNKDLQQWVYEYIKENGMIRQEQLMVLRNYREDNTMTQEMLIELLNGCVSTLSTSKKITLNERKLKKYFPAYYSKAAMEQVITSLLEQWKDAQEGKTDE
jgi:ParB family chromosome partitioning protein